MSTILVEFHYEICVCAYKKESSWRISEKMEIKKLFAKITNRFTNGFKRLVEDYNRESHPYSSQKMFLKPAVTDAFPDNPFVLAFPRKDMTSKEKIIFALEVDGTDSYMGLTRLTGLSLTETKIALEELIQEKEIFQKGVFYYPKPKTWMERFDLRNEMK